MKQTGPCAFWCPFLGTLLCGHAADLRESQVVLDFADVDAGMGGEQLANADAKRTLLRLKQKLEGLEGGACSTR